MMDGIFLMRDFVEFNITFETFLFRVFDRSKTIQAPLMHIYNDDGRLYKGV